MSKLTDSKRGVATLGLCGKMSDILASKRKWLDEKNTIRLFCKSKRSSRNLVPFQPFWWFTTNEWQLNSKQTIKIKRWQRMQYLIIIKHTTVQINLHKTHIITEIHITTDLFEHLKDQPINCYCIYNGSRFRLKQQNRNVRKTLMKKN